MRTERRELVAVFADKASHQWIVRDPEGNFWVIPPENDEPWDHRQPIQPSEEMDLQPVPGHYKDTLGLPF